MSNQITHAAHKVTYRWTFNQDVQSGTFWDGSPYVINKPGLKLTNVELETESGIQKSNEIISNLELGYAGKPGFEGELYINGLVKNPRGMHDYGPDGKQRNKGNAFDSRSFTTFDKGWTRYRRVLDPATKKHVRVPLATNLNSSYDAFDLNRFLETKSQLENGGIELELGDALIVQWSNFDIDCSYAWNIGRAGGFPYQKIKSRSCSMSYGTLFVLDKHPTEISFRPPVLWPEEDKTNRPIHAVSKINSVLPADDELVDNPITQFKVDDFRNDKSFTTFSYGMAFGGGTNYSQSMPLFAGSKDGSISAYGAYYIKPLLSRLETLYSKDVTTEQRLQNLKAVVQWGIDAFGSIKTYTSTSSGAGQKPCAARPWSIVSGYFLGDQAMRMPETTMMSDVVRSNGLLSARGAALEDEDGNTENDEVSNQSMVEIYGNPMSSLSAKKRWHALQTSLEAMCFFRVQDNPGSVLDYRTLGKTHRRIFSGAGADLNQLDESVHIGLVYKYRNVSTFSGSLAKIQWNSVPADLKTGWAATHDGKAATFWYSYVKVISGPGAGDTIYRIIKSWGDFRYSVPDRETNTAGYGFILDRAWQHGQPDESSVFEMMTCTEKNVGEIFYLIGPTRFRGMADANLSPTTPYASICEGPIVTLYGWMKYIEDKTGTNPDMDKDAVLMHEYIDRLIESNPYKWVNFSTDRYAMGCLPWEILILNKWYNRPDSRIEQAKTIDWKTLPGIKTWHGIDVSEFRKIEGDFNDDGIVDEKDLGAMIPVWGSNHPDFDLDKDGTVGVGDVRILLDKFGKTGDTP